MSKKLSRDELLDEAIVKAKEAEDWQLAEWLRAARGSDESARWFTTKINDLKTENERLQKELNRWRVEQVHAYGNWEDANKYAAELEKQNAKLRELTEDILNCIEIRATFGRPPTSEMFESFAQRASELGIEVE